MTYFYDLTLGLPHTNHRGLSEPLLLMQAGHFQWTSIAAATGGPLSRLRTASGGEVYAAFYYIEERLPRGVACSIGRSGCPTGRASTRRWRRTRLTFRIRSFASGTSS
jgi:hypothetical protein